MLQITEMELTIGSLFGKLVYYTTKKLLFVVTRDGMINNIMRGKLPDQYRGTVQFVEKLRVTRDLTHIDTERKTLFIDAFGLTDFIAWAFAQSPSKTPKAFRNYLESWFSADAIEFDMVLRAALRAAYRLDGPGEAGWFVRGALQHHSEAWTALQNSLR